MIRPEFRAELQQIIKDGQTILNDLIAEGFLPQGEYLKDLSYALQFQYETVSNPEFDLADLQGNLFTAREYFFTAYDNYKTEFGAENQPIFDLMSGMADDDRLFTKVENEITEQTIMEMTGQSETETTQANVAMMVGVGVAVVFGLFLMMKK